MYTIKQFSITKVDVSEDGNLDNKDFYIGIFYCCWVDQSTNDAQFKRFGPSNSSSSEHLMHSRVLFLQYIDRFQDMAPRNIIPIDSERRMKGRHLHEHLDKTLCHAGSMLCIDLTSNHFFSQLLKALAPSRTATYHIQME
jgi:hypothetical protein